MNFAELTAPEIRALSRNSTLVIAPIAAMEQHGQHLPVSTDTILAGAVAKGVEAALPEQTLVLPVLWLGASDHHLPRGGTLTSPLPTYEQILVDLLTPLLRDGFQRFMILNGHGGNIDPLRVALRRLDVDYSRAILTGAAYWDLAAEELVRLYEPEIRLEVRGWLRLRNPRFRRVFDSMDICQAVLASFFIRAAVGEFEIDDPRQLVPLLVGMARNKLAEQVRFHQRGRRDVRRVEGVDAGIDFQPTPEESPSQVVARRELLEVFRSRLSEEERAIADLRSQGLDWAAVSASMGSTPEARRKQFSRAIARVERELGLDSTLG